MPHVIGVEVIEDISGIASPVDGFARRFRHRAQSRLSDGSATASFTADYVDRAPGRRDAVAVILYEPDDEPARTRVLLRQQMRYPVYVAAGAPLMTEVVAGILEPGESPLDAARRETTEETGFTVDAADATRLGGPFYPSPGIMCEMVYVVAVKLPSGALDAPLPEGAGDGSPMEVGARPVVLSLNEALGLPARPPRADPADITLCDAKTEIALRRLRSWLQGEHP
ncbi:MAG: NUDIX hydrolase [Myxococcota bacterium]